MLFRYYINIFLLSALSISFMLHADPIETAQSSLQSLTQNCCSYNIATTINLVLDPAVTEKALINSAHKLLTPAQIQKINNDLTTHTLVDLLCKGMPTNISDMFRLLISYKREKIITPTLAHWIRYLYWNAHYCALAQANPRYKEFLSELVKNEQEIVKKGNVAFYHAIKPNILFCNDMYTQGWHIINGSLPSNDFLFMRFENVTKPKQIQKIRRLIATFIRKKIMSEKEGLHDMFAYAHKPMTKLVQKLAQRMNIADNKFHNSENCFIPKCIQCREYKEDLLNAIVVEKSANVISENLQSLDTNIIKEKMRKKMLFLNMPFFANLRAPYESTAFYFWENKNCHVDTLDSEKVFNKLGLSSYAKKYADEFKALALLHEKAANGKGVVVQFDFTPEQADNSVYVCGPCGPSMKLTLRSGDSIDSVSAINQTLCTNINNLENANDFQFCHLVADQQVNNGVTMKKHYYGDKKLIDEYHQTRDALFAKIRTDYQADQIKAA